MESFASQCLLLEFQACVEQLPKEIVVQPSIRTMRQWQVCMTPNNGFYNGKIIIYNIYLENYPNNIPDVIFQSGIVHPLINPHSTNFASQLLINEWNRYTRIYELIQAIYNSFVEIPQLKQVPNPEAYNILKSPDAKNTILGQLKTPSAAENHEHNEPKKWTPQKEKLCHVLYD
ncbi:Ubiquitin-conjugating enzyme family protein [Trichomonas vaginalis G3]|uniref:Ubiquitin-conjugating enzyme family protein n=1 Tax=Trichomonas vaginalis (strain ATCC PRA-98 / G3) TaxID=412133 RepID=A2FTA9_TRIV3|nr:sperm individualization protein family [Trichomonas vaginalis G3]EAX91861.1 Ubiquitin-conjugating enzyme family protein [Trichomonas vaginalis G3]KAI5506382.1 sperm individualization protein family [Trichomonas vaginalis G3]|eukprot:XP_001304791.1 Ubiquitin-conjugating enzyme family protein [Trichomonas vaginalis G3]